jgi:hypothetical protein
MKFEKILSDPDRVAATVMLAKYLREATQKERETIIAGWNWGVEWKYPPFGRLACATGNSWSIEDTIYGALILDCLESKENPRERLFVYCEVFNSCVLANLDAHKIISTIGQIFGGSIETSLKQWLNRTEEDKKLEAFGMAARKVDDGYEIYRK